jgi:hypothetical protein
MKNEKIKVTFEYTIKTIEPTLNFCLECALNIGQWHCMSRKLCKYTNETPQVYFFNGLVE